MFIATFHIHIVLCIFRNGLTCINSFDDPRINLKVPAGHMNLN